MWGLQPPWRGTNAPKDASDCQTKQNAEDLDRYLDGAGIYATSIHGNKNQQAREKALNNFARGQLFLADRKS